MEKLFIIRRQNKEIANIEIPAASNNVTKAGSLCSVAKVKFDEGKDIFNCYTVNPLYIRKSQAEEQYEEKQRKLEAEKKTSRTKIDKNKYWR